MNTFTVSIDRLLLEEYTNRETQRVGIALKPSRLVPIKTLEGFDCTVQPSLNRERIMALAELTFIERGDGVHLLGPPGTGKSHVATALGAAAVRASKRVYRTPLSEWIDSLIQADRAGRLKAKMQTDLRVALLLGDEIGFLPITPGGAGLFFQRVNARYEKGAMILTATIRFAEWGNRFGDPVVATALLDRLVHHAVGITINGNRYRLREHADLVPEPIRTKVSLVPPPPPKKRDGPGKGKEVRTYDGTPVPDAKVVPFSTVKVGEFYTAIDTCGTGGMVTLRFR